MKKVFWLLCFALAPLPSFGEFDIEGFLRVRGVSVQPHKLKTGKLLTNQSFRLQGAIYPNPDFQAHFWLLSSFDFGARQPMGEIFRIYAFGRWLINENLRLLIGRAPYEAGFHQFISSNEYEPYPYSFDGVFFTYGAKTVSLDLWGGYMPKTGDGEARESLNQGLGAFLDFKAVSEQLSRVSLHLIYLADSFGQPDSKKMTRYGIGLEGDISPVNVDYTFLAQAQGREFKFKAEDEAAFNMYHLELGYSHLKWHESRFFGGYHNDTVSYDPWLYDRHKSGGLLDLLLWGNMTYFFLGYSASFAEFFDVKVCFYDMRPTDSKGRVSLGRYGALLADSKKGGGRLFPPEGGHLGRELDIQLSKEMAEEFQLALLAGFFFPGRGMLSLFEDLDYYSSIQISAQYKF